MTTGTNNTPVLDEDQDENTKNNIRAGYKSVIENHPGTPLAGLLSEYMQLLEKSRFADSPGIREFLAAHSIEFMYAARRFGR